MNPNVIETLRETLWRRPLSEAEREQVRVWLAAHPEDAADWELDFALSERLRGLPPKPMPSNFTARVLEQVALDRRQAERVRPRAWWRMPLLRRVALTGGLAAAVFVSAVQYEANQRHQMVRSVVVLSDVAAVSDPVWLEDFDAIVKLGQVPPSDDDLLEALQ